MHRFAFNLMPGGFTNNLSSMFKPGKVDAQGGYSVYTSTFTYDPLSRLTKAIYPDEKQYGFSYNNIDNRTQMVATLSGSQTTINYTYNDDSGMTSAGSTAYTFDNKGNQITRSNSIGSETRTFNFDNKLVQSSPSAGSISTYVYDGNKNRISKSVGAATTRFINDVSGSLPNVLAEATAGNALTNYYVYGKGIISQGGPAQGSRTYPLEDGLGNIRYVTSSTGTTVNTYDYEPYRGLRSSSGSGVNMLFQGQQKDDETNLYYMRARMYDTEAGRFISRDPVEGYLTSPITQNPYIYAYNNPVNVSDPSGLDAKGLCLSCSGGLGVYGAGSICAMRTDSGQYGITASGAIGGTAGLGVSGGVGYKHDKNADSINELSGTETVMGLGVAVLGGLAREESVKKNPDTGKLQPGGSSTTSLNLGGEFEFHGAKEQTFVLGQTAAPGSW